MKITRVVLLPLILLGIALFGLSVRAGGDLLQDALETDYAYLQSQGEGNKYVIFGYTGNDWVTWDQSTKATYIGGYMAGMTTCQVYGQSLRSNGVLSYDYLNTESFNVPYRAGQYMIELDVFYNSYRNRDMPITIAFHRVNQMLKGR